MNSPAVGALCLLGVWVLFLLAEVSLYLVPEEEHPQLTVGRLVHGLGLHAHAVLVWGELIGTVLLVPQVEQTPGWRSHHQEVTVKVLPVEVDVFSTPAFDVNVKPS